MAEKNSSDEFLGCIGLIVTTIVSVVLLYVVSGFALSTAWGWFIVPLGLKEIGIAHAIGITSVFGLMNPNKVTNDQVKELGTWGLIGVTLFAPLISLGVAWVVNYFM